MSRIFSAIRRKWVPPALMSANLEGYTVLVTGANVGLGFEAALKYVSLGASTVIFGVRSMEKGNAAKDAIEEQTQRRGVIKVWHLDMDDSSSVKAFADRVSTEVERVDIALLNAGLHMASFTKSPEGWEETLQVNLLSTVLLALLLLPKLKEGAGALAAKTGAAAEEEQNNRIPHLTIVSSMAYKLVGHGEWEDAPDILQHFNTPDNYSGPRQYAVSKLLLMYAVDELAALAAAPAVPTTKAPTGDSASATSPPQVIVTPLCPGFCWSDLARHYSGFFYGVAKYIFYSLLAKSTEVGSRTLVNASLQGPEAHGKFYDVENIAE
ncbi:NAD(P)-binding protein [Xylona heveae TC161]|uniref:NAD(P)-binding protein n=1 Tax=Xylona heveae (strain CBS 132557 / TC161) TaxID=1328760 RepID=A0A165A6K8_XYLHT|nr:NAD(P)-binding protein [Xylona heveae TC161]KZF20024.1 NAD(P)-binding protein [Xylona heveae TC161]